MTTPGGTSAPTNFGEFTYSTPIPVVGSLTRRTGPTAGGTIVTITGANFVRGARVLFGPRLATHIVVVSPTKIVVKSPRWQGNPPRDGDHSGRYECSDACGPVHVLVEAYTSAVPALERPS